MSSVSLALLPDHLSAQSVSPREIVVPESAAMEAIDFLEGNGVHILGWEGWIKDVEGRVGHGSAPQGTASLQDLSAQEAAQVCRESMPEEARRWREENPNAGESLYFCITVKGHQ